MLADGFLLTSSEYIGASFYLQQQPTPYYLWIGRQDGTAIGGIQVNAANGGVNYKVGDQVTVVQTGGSNGVLQVATVDGTGKVTGIQVVTQGTAYTVANGLTTTGGSGTGLQVDILTLGENASQAVQACRVASPFWYLFTVLNSSDADNIAMTSWAQTASPVCQNFFVTTSAAVLNGTTGNVFDTLMKGNYNRYIGTYITTQGGVTPNNTYFACALMGLAAGRNTGLSRSYFILPFKNIVGMTVEPLTPSQYANITNKNGNAYISYASTYNSLSPGITGSGQYFDQILGIDMLVSDLQYDMTNTLYQYPAVPQTDEGQSILLHSANGSCGKSVNRGFLSSGVWQGQTILNLQAGMSIPGYLNQSPSYASLGAKPANRQAAPIYCAVILSEAVQSVLIAIYVQQ
jgi:hypothetical protein